MQQIEPKKWNEVYIGKRAKMLVFFGIFTVMLGVSFLARNKDVIAEKIKCSAFADLENGYQLAQEALKTNPRLDADKDGFACDKLIGKK